MKKNQLQMCVTPWVNLRHNAEQKEEKRLREQAKLELNL